MTWHGWLSLAVDLWWLGAALAGLAWLVSQAAKRLRWRWIRLRLRKELQALDLVGIARQRLP